MTLAEMNCVRNVAISDQIHVGTPSIVGIVFSVLTIVFQVVVLLLATRQLRRRKRDEEAETGEQKLITGFRGASCILSLICCLF